MPDTTHARIRIGGALSAAGIDELANGILAAGLGLDWESGLTEIQVHKEIRAAAAGRRPLALVASDVPGGQFEDLESACRELGLAYSRADEGHYTWTPTVVFWEPGMERPSEWTGTVIHHVPHLDARQIRELAAADGLHDELTLMERAQAFPIPLTIMGDA